MRWNSRRRARQLKGLECYLCGIRVGEGYECKRLYSVPIRGEEILVCKVCRDDLRNMSYYKRLRYVRRSMI